MVAAIGSSGSSAVETSASPSISGLEAQLARYQKELSNCVNCDSANTAEGKESIQAISNKISSVKVRIEALEDTKPQNATTTVPTQDSSVAQPASNKKPSPPATASTGIGSLIDIHA